jgi:glutamine cyclotransferase
MKLPRFLFAILGIGLLPACQCGQNKPESALPDDLLSKRAFFTFEPVLSPQPAGREISFAFSFSDSSRIPDSLIYRIDNKQTGKHKLQGDFSFQYIWNSAGAVCGGHQFTVEAWKNGKMMENAGQEIFLSSDIEPEMYGYEVVKSLPHEGSSFTQGLEWKGNLLFEGTGLNGKSALMQVDPQTGKAIQKIALGQEYFGEGITIMGNMLYQITWQNKKGFVYTLPELKKTQDFSYATEGWGLSSWKGDLIMTDGSNRLYFLDAQNFQTKKSIQVWDRKSPVSQLNELESAEGGIWANKYTTDTLVKFDPETGKVLAYLDLSGLLKKEDETGNEDVLNGIAYRADEGLYYVTGKNWPKMYAIRLVKRRRA